jgi:hypothetical protein
VRPPAPHCTARPPVATPYRRLSASLPYRRAEELKTLYRDGMSALKIRVENGRIKLDEPTDLPNGTELVVVPVNELEDVVLMQDDGLNDEERQELLRSIDEGLADVDAGNVHDFREVVASLGTRT